MLSNMGEVISRIKLDNLILLKQLENLPSVLQITAKMDEIWVDGMELTAEAAIATPSSTLDPQSSTCSSATVSTATTISISVSLLLHWVL